MNSTFSTALRAYRQRAGISMCETARRSGLTASVVSRYESGERRPSPDSVDTLADVLDLNARDRLRLHLSAGFVPSTVTLKPELIDVLADIIALTEFRSEEAA